VDGATVHIRAEHAPFHVEHQLLITAGAAFLRIEALAAPRLLRVDAGQAAPLALWRLSRGLFLGLRHERTSGETHAKHHQQQAPITT